MPTTRSWGSDEPDSTLDVCPATWDQTAGPRELDETPAAIGRYVVLEQLGAGGMGVVHAAFDPKLGRKVAIKLIHNAGGRRPINGEPRLLREARALARLSHPNVVAVFDVGLVGDRVFLAMEHVEGQTLGQWQRGQTRSWRDVLAAYVQAGRGLAAAHLQQLVHRDFKPANALIDAAGRVRVLDFGLAIAAEDDALESSNSDAITACSRLTLSGVVMGTPAYMSPQQLKGEAPDASSDQFSFCVALFEALYGQRPFSGSTVGQLAARANAGAFASLDDRRDVPAWLHHALRRGLAAQPERRWPSMHALLRHLDPQRRRRRSRVAGSATLGAVGVTIIALHASAPPPDACAAAADKIAASWDDQARGAVRDAIVGGGLTYADDTWTLVEDGLDQYARQWTEARRQACHQDAAVAPPQTLDLRMQCLDERLETFSALVDVLATADDAVVRNATRAVASLPGPARCTDDAALLTAPHDARGNEQVAAIRRTLATGRAQLLAGRYDTGIEIAKSALEQARRSQHRSTVAEALHQVGNFEERLGHYAQAEATLTEAAILAREIGHAEIAAESMLQLAGVVGYVLARKEEGIAWGRHAQAMIERAQLGRRAQAKLANNVGAVFFRAGDFEAARDQYEDAVALLRGSVGPRARQELASTHNNLGNSYAQLERLDEAHHNLQRALELTEQMRGSDHPDLAVMVANAANIDLDRGRADAAVAGHQRALEIRLATLPPLHPFVASSHMNLGLAYASREQPDLAIEHLRRAVELKEAAMGRSHPDLALALNNLGEIQRELGDVQAAIASHGRARDIWLDAQGPEHPFVGYPTTNLGLDYLAAGDLVQAEALLGRAMEICAANPHDVTLQALTELGTAQLLVQSNQEPAQALALAGRAHTALTDTRYPTQARQAAQLVAQLQSGAISR